MFDNIYAEKKEKKKLVCFVIYLPIPKDREAYLTKLHHNQDGGRLSGCFIRFLTNMDSNNNFKILLALITWNTTQSMLKFICYVQIHTLLDKI